MNQVEIKKRQVEMVSYVLEMITLLVLGKLLGDNGIAYLAFALESFMFFWTFAGGQLRDVLGKLLRGRSTRGQYRNASLFKKNVLVLEGVGGLLGSVLLFVCSGLLGEQVFGVTYSVILMRMLAPVVAIRTFSAILLGYFQGEGTELPTVISCLMRQICILGFSLLFANLFKIHGQKVSALLRQDNFTAMYGGMGVALAILVSEILVLLFLFLLYQKSGKNEKKNNSGGMRVTDTFGSQARVLYGGLLPLVFVAFLQQLPIWTGMFFYSRGPASTDGFNAYGVLYGRYIPLTGILLFPACVLLLESCYKVAGCVRREEQRYARGNFSGGLHMGVVYGMFFAVFVAILAPQVAGIFCGTGAEPAVQMLRFGSFILLFAIVGFYLSEILMLLGGKFQILGLLALYNMVFVICLLLFLNKGRMGVMALVYAGLISGAVYAAAAGALLFYQTRMNIDWLQCVAIPAGTACVVGLIIMFAGKLATPHLGNLVTVLICLVLGQICYWILLMIMRNFREQELNYTPGGKLIRRLGQIFRVY